MSSKSNCNYFSVAIFIILACLFWFLGYIKVPYFDTRKDFWLGFIACALIFILGYLLFKISVFSLKIRTNPTSDAEIKNHTKIYIYGYIIAGLILLLSITCIYYFGQLRITEAKLIESNAALLNVADLQLSTPTPEDSL